MAQEALLARIETALAGAKLSERKALLRADVGLDFIRDIRRRGHSPNVDKLKRLAHALDRPFAYFADAIRPDLEQSEAPEASAVIYVIGAVQAGVWREALEWPDREDRFSIRVPVDDRFPKVKLFGLLVKGSSMNLEFPDGTIVLVMKFGDIERPLKPKDFVVVMRRSSSGASFEATVKQYDVDDRDRHVLWPRSTDPDFQTPYILTDADHFMSGTNVVPLPPVASAGLLQPWPDDAHEAGVPDTQIVGLVVGSYRRQPL